MDALSRIGARRIADTPALAAFAEGATHPTDDNGLVEFRVAVTTAEGLLAKMHEAR